MKAVLIHQFGSPAVLSLEDAPEPPVSTGEVLIRVHAAGVNPVDLETRAGRGVAGRLKGFPVILGWNLSGVVETLGTGTARFKVGDQVYGVPRFPDLSKTYAEYAVAPESSLAFKPRNLTHTQAAAVPLAGLTALQALDIMNLQTGQTLLIHAADSGVGHLAVQLARARGVLVIGAAPGSSEPFVRALGAAFFDSDTGPFEDHLDPVDAVLDTLGGETLARSFAVVKPGGWVVSVVENGSHQCRQQRPDIRTERIQARPNGLQLEQLASLIEDGRLRPVPDAVLPLRDAARAHLLSLQPSAAGRVVLEVRARPP